MRVLRDRQGAWGPGDRDQRGAALLLTFLVLIVILMIVYQVSRITSSERNEAYRSLTLTQMDFAIQAALLENQRFLREDADQGGAGAEGDLDAGADTGGDFPEGGDDLEGEGEGGEEGPSDSLMDSWATVQQSTIGEVDVISFVVDEDRKFNILGMLNEDEELANEAEAIVTRILDRCREGSMLDIDAGTATEMAQAMRRYMEDRFSETYPTPNLVGQEEGRPVLPLSMREFLVVPPFQEHHFRDYFDEQDNRVHAIDQFLTIYSSPTLGQSATSELGFAVNANTAPLQVLAGLFDSRRIDPRVWLEIVDYRNEERETDADEEEELAFRQNRFNEELPELQVFTDLSQIEELPTMADMDPEVRNEILARLKVESEVFSITILAKKSTRSGSDVQDFEATRQEVEKQEQAGTDLVRVVRKVVWRQSGEEGASMATLIPWMVLDYVPLELLDQPEF